jgi:aldose 1-epimerase
MSFSIDIQPISSFKRIRITDLSTHVYIEIMSKGAILNSWMQSSENWDIIEGNDFTNGWGQYESNGFKSGKMNPFACRLKNGAYTHLNQSYKIEHFYLGDHALHGILYDAEYSIVSTEMQDNKASVLLAHAYKGTDKGFQFEYTVQVEWSFHKENKITVQTSIINHSQVPIPMMDGWHPYFKLGDTINDCSLQFQNKGLLEYDASLVPTGNILDDTVFENGCVLSNTKLDNGYLLNDTNPSCTLQNNTYKLIIIPSSAYPYLQLYTPEDRKSIAIENLSAAPDCFNNKMGLQIMQPQSSWNLETSYQLFHT